LETPANSASISMPLFAIHHPGFQKGIVNCLWNHSRIKGIAQPQLHGIVCEKVSEHKGNVGYNAAADKYEDMVKAGIIDPTKVTRTALQNASSVAILLLTSDALIAEKPKEEKGGKGHGGGEDMY